MKNLEQVRAANALDAGKKNYRGVKDGEVVKKIPAMIRENGLLTALAFAVERKDGDALKHEGHHGVWKAIIEHLAHKDIKRLARSCSPDDLVVFLAQDANATAACLRDITEETLAYLNYLRRFAQ